MNQSKRERKGRHPPPSLQTKTSKHFSNLQFILLSCTVPLPQTAYEETIIRERNVWNWIFKLQVLLDWELNPVMLIKVDLY